MNSTLLPLIRSGSRIALAGILCGSAAAQGAFELSDLAVVKPLLAMAGGDFEVESMELGDRAVVATGGGFDLEAVLTSVPPILVFGDAALFITMSGGEATVSWTAPGGGHVLEWSRSVGPTASWSPVTPAPTEDRFTVAPALDGPRFFRLRR